MRLISLLVYLAIMAFSLIKGFVVIFFVMLALLAIAVACMPYYKKNTIKVAKKKILEAQKLKSSGGTVTPFIEVNSSPWYVLAQLPGVSIQMAKHAVELRRKNGPYPSINVFIQVIGLKRVFVEHIKAIAYVKKEVAPIKVDKGSPF